MQKLARFLIRQHAIYDSFYIADLGVLRGKINEWRKELPDVRPFYAIKCNPDKTMLKTMIAEGLGFDCASKKEIETALSLGCKPSDIVFAHPVKKLDYLRYAVGAGVGLTTFDSFSELKKIKDVGGGIGCLLRLKVDNPTARVQLGLKYGAEESEYKGLLDAARDMGVRVVGCSFHVGSASSDPSVFRRAMGLSALARDYGEKVGFGMRILDIGGGFTKETFKESAAVLRGEIERHFPASSGATVIAEPGRFFAEEVFTFYTPVVGYRERAGGFEYWIADGLYGSFNCKIYDGQEPAYEVMRRDDGGYEEEGDEKLYDSVLFGQSCDSLDVVEKKIRLPRLENGDFIVVPRFGAYTIAGSCDFNGLPMTNPKVFYTGMYLGE